MTIRLPPAQLTAPEYADMRQGTILHRVHRTTYRAAQFNPGLGGPTRFAPFNDSAGVPVPSLYAGTTLRAAIHETIFHDIPANAGTKAVRRQEVHMRTHSEIELVRDLRLVALRNPTLGRWRISRNDLISSSPALYGQTVLWAQAVHRDIWDADGLVWTSNQCDPDGCCLFFGDRVRETDFAVRGARDGITDKAFQWDVRDAGRQRGIVLTV